jgi:hypothetical protein
MQTRREAPPTQAYRYRYQYHLPSKERKTSETDYFGVREHVPGAIRDGNDEVAGVNVDGRHDQLSGLTGREGGRWGCRIQSWSAAGCHAMYILYGGSKSREIADTVARSPVGPGNSACGMRRGSSRMEAAMLGREAFSPE